MGARTRSQKTGTPISGIAVAPSRTVWEDNSLGQGTLGQMSVFRSTTSNGVTHMLDVHVQLNPDPPGTMTIQQEV